MNENEYLRILSESIYNLRKESGLTQESLAEKLNISFQAVSKWENEQSSPDIILLPLLADIFGVSVDRLFGRDTASLAAEAADIAPWEDDDTLWGLVFQGRRLIKNCKDLSNFTFKVEGEALNVKSNCSISCGNVSGSVQAGVDVHCGDVAGGANAGVNVFCGDVAGGANAGVSVSCKSMEGR